MSNDRDWVLRIDGKEYEPLPISWIDAGVDEEGAGPPCLAVSAATIRNTIHIRYAHPNGLAVGAIYYPGVRKKSGLVPKIAEHGDWPRSIPAGTLEPIDMARDKERGYLEDVWERRAEEALGISLQSTLQQYPDRCRETGDI